MESTFTPDDTRRQRLQGFVGTVCVGSTGRLGIVTHIAVEYGQWTACGFGLDGKGVWTSKDPVEIATAEDFYHKLKSRFYGRLSALDGFLPEEIDNIAMAVVETLEQRKFFSSDLGKSIDINNTTPEGFAQLRQDVVSEIQAGVDQSIGLGIYAESIVKPPKLNEARCLDTNRDDIVANRPSNVGDDFDNDGQGLV